MDITNNRLYKKHSVDIYNVSKTLIKKVSQKVLNKITKNIDENKKTKIFLSNTDDTVIQIVEHLLKSIEKLNTSNKNIICDNLIIVSDCLLLTNLDDIKIIKPLYTRLAKIISKDVLSKILFHDEKFNDLLLDNDKDYLQPVKKICTAATKYADMLIQEKFDIFLLGISKKNILSSNFISLDDCRMGENYIKLKSSIIIPNNNYRDQLQNRLMLIKELSSCVDNEKFNLEPHDIITEQYILQLTELFIAIIVNNSLEEGLSPEIHICTHGKNKIKPVRSLLYSTGFDTKQPNTILHEKPFIDANIHIHTDFEAIEATAIEEYNNVSYDFLNNSPKVTVHETKYYLLEKKHGRGKFKREVRCVNEGEKDLIEGKDYFLEDQVKHDYPRINKEEKALIEGRDYFLENPPVKCNYQPLLKKEYIFSKEQIIDFLEYKPINTKDIIDDIKLKDQFKLPEVIRIKKSAQILNTSKQICPRSYFPIDSSKVKDLHDDIGKEDSIFKSLIPKINHCIIGAHQDDIELQSLSSSPDIWKYPLELKTPFNVLGITCTDGGSRSVEHLLGWENIDPITISTIRNEEQIEVGISSGISHIILNIDSRSNQGQFPYDGSLAKVPTLRDTVYLFQAIFLNFTDKLSRISTHDPKDNHSSHKACTNIIIHTLIGKIFKNKIPLFQHLQKLNNSLEVIAVPIWGNANFGNTEYEKTTIILEDGAFSLFLFSFSKFYSQIDGRFNIQEAFDHIGLYNKIMNCSDPYGVSQADPIEIQRHFNYVVINDYLSLCIMGVRIASIKDLCKYDIERRRENDTEKCATLDSNTSAVLSVIQTEEVENKESMMIDS